MFQGVNTRLTGLCFVSQPGVRTHYVEMGSGPPVLLCHGFPESWYSWRFQVSHVPSLQHPNSFQCVRTCALSCRFQPWLQQGSGSWLWTWRDLASPRHLLVGKHPKYLMHVFVYLILHNLFICWLADVEEYSQEHLCKVQTLQSETMWNIMIFIYSNVSLFAGFNHIPR